MLFAHPAETMHDDRLVTTTMSIVEIERLQDALQDGRLDGVFRPATARAMLNDLSAAKSASAYL